MNILETINTALTALRSNKVRSILTMLGVVIGVFAVLSLVSLVQGVRNYVTDQFSALGSNLILVAPGAIRPGNDPAAAFSNNKLSVKDVDDINRFASDYIVGASPNIRLGKKVTYKTKSFFTTIAGFNADFTKITKFEIARGRAFNRQELDSSAKVALIGPQVTKEIFGSIDPLGKKVKLGSDYFLIIGTLVSKGQNVDDRLVVPYTALQDTYGIKKLSGITAKAKEGVDMDTAMRQIEIILLKNHKKDEFTVISQKDILSSIQNILNMLSIGLSSIAGISLLVGGIGIMNIMLVSVNERVREIGLRKALGATPVNIAFQFLIESITISLLGGLIGIFFGWLLTLALHAFVRAQMPLWSIFLAIGFSVFVGVLFGTYPAIQASKKEPIEALRYE